MKITDALEFIQLCWVNEMNMPECILSEPAGRQAGDNEAKLYARIYPATLDKSI